MNPDTSALSAAFLQVEATTLLSLEERADVQFLIRWLESLRVVDDGHFIRVMVLTLTLCERLSMTSTPAARRIVMCAGLLHDVGKALISADILNKQGPLSNDERRVIERHPALGMRLLATLPALEPEVIQATLHHHEAYNGDGYPYGLAGLQIPRLARVLSVADVYDALTSTRPYRVAWTHTEAIQYLNRYTGTLFDPLPVWALNLIKSGR
ncbi:HD-GYP domain-containing protein [Deinococcus ruber]|uniref:HD-GYP domain-containing protein n=1 Tax=Deinococcus ruber TaxID=1848197 RepID=A0A918C4W1_9DEIO|nr:HD domain-containing phosphohydrolase [Deinococcus ruber]GGR05986.1 hypothetical protein GCM10008957_18430 [Deinococcus ruber]